MDRRRLLHVTGVVTAGLIAGCSDRGSDGADTPTREPTQVTTTAGEDVTIVSAGVQFPEDGGPRVNYHLRNEGATDATVSVRTVLTLEGGDSYEGRAFADVPAGREVVLEYRIVEYSALPDAAASDVRRGRGTYEVYLNGESRGSL